MPAVAVFRSAASVEDMRLGTEGPPTIPHRQRSQVEGLSRAESLNSFCNTLLHAWELPCTTTSFYFSSPIRAAKTVKLQGLLAPLYA
ncbi:hypothetical protein L3Q82_004614 [Scortum barcoo]|uniref:Uncharacterized protein n=1 Tax=Scortum barcoo TaxID=214431 RepID=A0ACB8VGU9_9TELE|nr:hypothetical protein L3Q82_004614 [Scortum barcoo]